MIVKARLPGSVGSRTKAAASVVKSIAIRPSRPRVAMVRAFKVDEADKATEWKSFAKVYDYSNAANPAVTPVPIDLFSSHAHKEGPTRIITYDLQDALRSPYPATTPNLLASFVRIQAGDDIETHARATSQVFAVIRGKGYSQSEFGRVHWKQGDVFALPTTPEYVRHFADKDSTEHGGPALFWVSDEPLLKYLGVLPSELKFDPTYFDSEEVRRRVLDMKDDPKFASANRLGLILGTEATATITRTLTHVLWALYDLLPGQGVQAAHKHASAAISLVLSAERGTCFTLMSQEIDALGQLLDPVKVDWVTGGALVTPPGWWHSHHNMGKADAWLLPVQDAGLYAYQRTLDLRFAAQEAEVIKEKIERGTLHEGEDIRRLSERDQQQ
eukprot:jgi/Chrzof1/1060/Cz01g38250.t1